MSSHEVRPVERHCDVAVIGGSAAGLAAALQLGRQRRSVIVVDAGEPRNAPAGHVHGFLGRDGVAPSELLRAGRDEVRSYGGELLCNRVGTVERIDDGRFRLRLSSGDDVVARRVLVATGVEDLLPAVDGLASHWGRDVIHCPFCHGFEVRDRRLVQIVTDPSGLHSSGLWRNLTDRLTVLVDPAVAAAHQGQLAALAEAGAEVRTGRALRVADGPGGAVSAVQCADGTLVDADAVAVSPRFRARAEPLEPLGLRLAGHHSGLGEIVPTGPTGSTAVPGLYAAGNVTDPGQQVLAAAADGSRVGAMICFDLADEEVRTGSRPSANRADWDHRYGEGPIWSGNPNGALVDEIGDMGPGRALDVGAGEGGDALWLAERGWQVTAADVSVRALDRISAAAARGGLRVDCRLADANDRDPFEEGAFDLVSAFYASIPRTPDGRGVRNLLAAVAPGGTLLFVAHDSEAMRSAVHESGRRPPFDPDAFVRPADVAAALADAAGWDVEIHGRRPRRPGAASSHHIDDVVLRARRRR